MKALQIFFAGPKGSGKSALIRKIQQKEELKTEKFNLYSFKQGGSLIYLADTPYDIRAIKPTLGLMAESDAIVLCISAIDGVNQALGELILLVNYLNIKNGVIAITKKDSSTPDELESLKTKLRAVLAESGLKDAEIVETSTITDEGITELKGELFKLGPKKRKQGNFKMPVEAAKEFKSGLTNVFGIIESGNVKKYDKIIAMPWGKEFIVQEIHRHGEVVENAEAGERVGITFKGLYPWDIQMGDILTAEGKLEKAKKLKLELEITQFFKDELRSGSEVQLNIGLQTFPVTVIKITKDGTETNSAKPGETVEIEVETKLPFAFEPNQPCIIINPEAHWRSIKVVGSGKAKEGLGD